MSADASLLPETPSLLKPDDDRPVGYAGLWRRLWFRYWVLSAARRRALYAELAGYIGDNAYSISQALSAVYDAFSNDGEKPEDPVAQVAFIWLKMVEQGADLHEAMAGWVPSADTMMALAGERGGDLGGQLNRLVEKSDEMAELVATLLVSFAAPFGTVAGLDYACWYLGVEVLPQLNPQGLEFSGSGGQLAAICQLAAHYALLPPIIIGLLLLSVAISLPFLTGKIRIFLDRFFPYSMYRIFTGHLVLSSLSTLMGATGKESDALTALRETSTPYVRERVDGWLEHVLAGATFGEAMSVSGFMYPEPLLIAQMRSASRRSGMSVSIATANTAFQARSIRAIRAMASTVFQVSGFTMFFAVIFIVKAMSSIYGQIGQSFNPS